MEVSSVLIGSLSMSLLALFGIGDARFSAVECAHKKEKYLQSVHK
jgi:hypothetical protein